MRKNFLFADTQLSKVLEVDSESKDNIFSDQILFKDGCWLELSLTEHHPKPRPPSIDNKWEWRIRFWDDSNVVLGSVYWDPDKEFYPKFGRLSQGLYVACSESELKDFLIKRSRYLGEWLLWNML